MRTKPIVTAAQPQKDTVTYDRIWFIIKTLTIGYIIIAAVVGTYTLLGASTC